MRIEDIIDFEGFDKVRHGNCYEDLIDLRDDIREYIKTEYLDDIDDFADNATAEEIYDASAVVLHRHYMNKHFYQGEMEDFGFDESEYYGNLI